MPSHPFILPLERDDVGITIGMPSAHDHCTPRSYPSSDWQPGARWNIINEMRWPGLIEEEEIVFLISMKWWTGWRMREAGMPGTESGGDRVRMAPPIDNSDLLAKRKKDIPNGRALPLGLKVEVDFVVVSHAAWHLLKTW